MADEIVLDASVAAKFYFYEPGTEAARALLTSDIWIVAPELLLVEMASVSAMRVRRGLEEQGRASAAVRSVTELVNEIVPLSALAHRAYELAVDHGFSAYDGCYVALAEVRGAQVVTADARLIRRAAEAKLAHLLRALSP